jgi:hypothetical protein
LGRGGSGSGAFVLEALAAEDGASLSGLEGDGGLFAAGGAIGAGLHLGVLALAGSVGLQAELFGAFGLAAFAALGFVLELFVVEEELFAGGEDEIGTTVDALESLVLEFHSNLPPGAEDPLRIPHHGRGRSLVERSCTLFKN